jgi:hypothetical protein
MICPYCKETILDDAVKCRHCGSMLGPDPFAPPAGAVSEAEFRAFIGKNSGYYLQNFAKFTRNGRESFTLTWNWSACAVTFIWMLYRKMYLQAAVTFLIFCVPGLNILLHIAVGAVGNYLYYRYARDKILESRVEFPSQAPSPDLSQIGGVHSWAITAGIALAVIAIVSFSFCFAAISSFILGMLP